MENKAWPCFKLKKLSAGLNAITSSSFEPEAIEESQQLANCFFEKVAQAAIKLTTPRLQLQQDNCSIGLSSA